MMSSKNQLLLFLIVLFLNMTQCNRRYRKSRTPKTRPLKYENFSSDDLPSDKQVTVFLHKSTQKSLRYTVGIDSSHISSVITTCSSPVKWSMKFANDTKSDKIYEDTTIGSFVAKSFIANKGVYILQLVPLERDTYVHIYISTEQGGPAALQKASLQKLELFKRQRKRKITVKWKASLIDPQWTVHCLVVSTKQTYPSLCSAESAKNAQLGSVFRPVAIRQKSYVSEISDKEPAIECVGKKTQYTVSNLQQAQTYFFSLFAVNVYSNLTYPFGSASMVFDTKVPSINLKEARAASANLKKYDGKVVFRYKVGRKSGKTLNVYVVPCGTAVSVEVLLKNKKVVPRRKVQRLGRIVINSPAKGSRYYIKISTKNDDYLKRPSGVEVYATTKPGSQVPLPMMPSETSVKEYESLRECHSVTIGWLPSPDENISEFCFVIKEGRLQEGEDFENINQCGLENRLKKSIDYVLQYCKEFIQNTHVLTEKINHLKPGRYYNIQVTVKKPKGKSLSYDLVETHTLPTCDNLLNFNTSFV